MEISHLFLYGYKLRIYIYSSASHFEQSTYTDVCRNQTKSTCFNIIIWSHPPSLSLHQSKHRYCIGPISWIQDSPKFNIYLCYSSSLRAAIMYVVPTAIIEELTLYWLFAFCQHFQVHSSKLNYVVLSERPIFPCSLPVITAKDGISHDFFFFGQTHCIGYPSTNRSKVKRLAIPNNIITITIAANSHSPFLLLNERGKGISHTKVLLRWWGCGLRD